MIIDKELKVGRFPLNQIYLGDSLDIVKDIPERSIDLILEDMPYNTTACEWDVKIDLQLYWETRLRILKPTGVVVLTASQPFTTDLINSNRKMFKYCWVWDKGTAGNFVIAKIRPLQYHEDILIFGDGKVKYNPIMGYADKGKIRPIIDGYKAPEHTKIKSGKQLYSEDYDNERRFPNTILNISKMGKECNPIHSIHPTQKPVGLFEYLIRTYTNEGDLVFDGFGGSGTTAIAAHKSKRNFIVVEKEKKYFDLATKRLKNERAQFELF
ncbi:MAG: site-specific DNA-methyltransferase [Ignavibacteriales bacterium]|nr:site-specific DNA-methyltransferase [Ignavibacteriales bacterium]